MKYQNIEFFNIEEIKKDGTLLRFEESLILSLGNEEHQRGRFYGYRSIGAELRFKTVAPFFDITLSAYKEDCHIYVFFGDYFHQRYQLIKNQTTTIHIEKPTKLQIENLPKGGFSSDVIRIVIGYSGYVQYIGINTFGFERIPPRDEEVPTQTLAIYGSSISHGSEALDYIDSYAFILSRLLNINVLNKAIPGSCQAEFQMIDFLKKLNYDACFIEFGVNVLGLYSLEEYQKHVSYILKQLSGKPLYITGVLQNGNMLQKDTILAEHYQEFNAYMHGLQNIQYVDEQLLLPRFESLTTDLLHPSNFGQMLIALGLEKVLKSKF